MSAYRLHDASWARIVEHRVRRPRAIEARLASRRRPESIVRPDGQMVLLAGNHHIDPRSGAPVTRRELLARMVEALSMSDVDGVIASPDLLEELTLLNVLEHRLAFATHPSTRFDGLLVSQTADIDPALPAIVQLSSEDASRPEAETSWTSWIDSLQRVSSTAATGAGLWLSLPPVRGFANLAEASGFPIVIRDVDVPIDPVAWADFFQATLPPTVRGIVLGVSALFPHERSVADATATIAGSARAVGETY